MFELPRQIASLMRDFKPDWFIAGGWAIDLFLGKQTRPHEDIEIAIFRKDQLNLQNYLKDWNLKKIVASELSEWKKDDFLELPVHEIQCFKENNEPQLLEVLLNETNGKDWILRRDKRITKPISKLFLTANSGIKFLRPEIVLLYKSKNPREKDEDDFIAVKDFLDFEGKEWLKNALSVCYSEHHWLQNL
jgi:hypothetical protein